MKIIQSGHSFRVYDDGMVVYDHLPAQAYSVNCDKMSGPYLQKYADITVSEKVYGIHIEKVTKVLNSFSLFNRNLGVILSGDKGIGKTLFSKMLAVKAMEAGYPLLIVNSYFPGIADYINSIEQEVVLLFDEFDKTFAGREEDGPQTEMLTLFDGIAQGKKMFVVTCNELSRLNSFLVNRPGRFHYHFRFEYPTPDEIRAYLTDKLLESYYTEIEKVVHFSRRINLNLGLPFEEAIKDLNILNIAGERYNLIFHFSNGNTYRLKSYRMDTFCDITESVDIEDPESRYDIGRCVFNPSEVIWDPTTNLQLIPASALEFKLAPWIKDPYDPENDSDTEKRIKEVYGSNSNFSITHISVHRVREKNMHYMV